MFGGELIKIISEKRLGDEKGKFQYPRYNQYQWEFLVDWERQYITLIRSKKYAKGQIACQSTDNQTFVRITNLSNYQFVSVRTEFPYAAFHSNKTQNHCVIQNYILVDIVCCQFRRNCTIRKAASLLTIFNNLCQNEQFPYCITMWISRLHDNFMKITILTASVCH